MNTFQVVYLTEDDQRRAIEQLNRFHLSHNVGMNDCLIAAAAERLQLSLYTANLKRFGVLLPNRARAPY